jgi:hypothetical protein
VSSSRTVFFTLSNSLAYDTAHTVEIPTGALIVKQGDHCTNQLKNVAGATLNLPVQSDPRGSFGFVKFDAQSIMGIVGTEDSSLALDDPTDLNNVNAQTLLIYQFTTANGTLSFGSSGTFTIQKNGSTVQTIDLSETYAADQVSELFWISGSTVYINPTVDLEPGANYSITASAGAIGFSNGCEIANWEGGTHTFRVYPGVEITSITNDGTNLDLQMNHAFTKGTGNITIRGSDSTVIGTVDITSGNVSII